MTEQEVRDRVGDEAMAQMQILVNSGLVATKGEAHAMMAFACLVGRAVLREAHGLPQEGGETDFDEDGQ